MYLTDMPGDWPFDMLKMRFFPLRNELDRMRMATAIVTVSRCDDSAVRAVCADTASSKIDLSLSSFGC